MRLRRILLLLLVGLLAGSALLTPVPRLLDPRLPTLDPPSAHADSPNDWPMFRHDPAHTGYNPDETTIKPPLRLKWSYTMGEVDSSPAVVGGVVYVGSGDRKVYALDAASGALRWSYTTGDYVFSTPAVLGGVVYVGSDKIYALDAATGALRWSYTTGGYVHSSPAVVGGVVYVGSNDGKVYALDATTGAIRWSYATGAEVASSPAVADGVVYVGSYDNKVYALDAATGALRWSYTTTYDVLSSPAVADGVVYIGAGYPDSKVYALDAATGALRWSYTTAGYVSASPAVVGGVVYVGAQAGNVYALDAATGGLKWSYATEGWVYSSPAVANGVVYVGSGGGKLYAVEATTGALLGSYAVGTRVYSSPAVAIGMVYVGSRDGKKIYAFETDKPWPMFGHDPARTGYNPDETQLKPPLRLKWSYATGGPGYTSSPAVANGFVYVGSRDNKVYALEAATGAFKWSYTTGGDVDSSPAVAGGVVYVGSCDGKVYAVDAGTGDLRWSYNTGGCIAYSSPAVVGGVVYVGSHDGGKLIALDATTGVLKWSYGVSYIAVSPAVVDGVVYGGSSGGRDIFALDAATGTLKWRFETGGWVGSSPAVVGGTVYAISWDGKVYALDAATGALKWSYQTGSTSNNSSPAVANGVVYVGSWNGRLYALDAATGALKWSYLTGGPIYWSSPAVANGVVYVGSNDNRLYALDAATGALRWSYQTGSPIDSSPAVLDGVLYMGYSHAGTFYAFESQPPPPTPTYSITGEVRDVSNNPIPGVTVSAGAGRSSITDSNGAYTLAGLPAGSYTLTPSKAGYTFAPRTRTVVVPPDANGVDFRGYDKAPIVFVHGWQGLNFSQSCEWANPEASFESVDNDLRAAGYHVDYARLESSSCYTPPIRENVWRLQNAIALAKAATNRDKVILIAHSMGGLVARAYVEGPDYAKDVAALFTFGTPHLGIPTSALLFLALNNPIIGIAAGATLAAYCGLLQPAACEMLDAAMPTFNQDFRKRDGVDYHLVSGDAPFLSRNARGKIMDVLIRGGDDGIVPTSSGTGLSGTLDRYRTDEVHGNMFGSRSYFVREGGQSKSFLECLKPALVDRTLDGIPYTCGTRSTMAAAEEAAPSLAQRVPFESGTLLPGQTVTRSIPLGSGPALFAAQWQTGTLSVTLVDPTLRRIDPAYASSHPDLVSYESEATAATYYVTSTVPGAWQLVLQGTSLPAEGTGYTTFAAFDSEVALAGTTDKAWYAAGVPATIAATLLGSPASAVITATIFRPDRVTDTVVLAPLGAGQYAATYTVPPAPGYAEVRLAAGGATAGGAPFQREVALTVQIASSGFALTGLYGDTPHPRSPGSFFYQALTVTVGINALVSGTVGLSGDLVAADGTVMAHAVASQETITGTATLALRFDGDSIYASQRDGPYTLSNLLLTDQRKAALVVAEAQNVYSTASYDYRRFASGKVYLPLVIKSVGGW